jgi:hypothetical protein
LVIGSSVPAVAIPIVDHDLHDDERLYFGHKRSPRLSVDADNVCTC